jgi:hypothetical protein
MIKGCLSLISGLLALIGLFFLFKDCGSVKTPSPPASIQQKQNEIQPTNNTAKSDSNESKFAEVNSITVRNKIIKVGDKSDYVFSILKPSDRIKEPDIVRNPQLSIRPVVTQHYEVDGKVFDIVIILKRESDPYRVGKIFLKNKESSDKLLTDNNKQNTDWFITIMFQNLK